MAGRMPKTLDNINKGIVNGSSQQPTFAERPNKTHQPIVFEDLPEVEKPTLIPRKQHVKESSVEQESMFEEVTVPAKQSSAQHTTTYERLPEGHKARYVKRPDVPVENYTDRIRTTSFNVYDKELRKWLKDFSENNQDNGGCPIPQSFLLEIVLGILHYDLKIEPDGYRTREEFIADLKRKMNIQ